MAVKTINRSIWPVLPVGASCDKKVSGKQELPQLHLGLTQATVTLAKTSLLRRSGSWGEVGTAWNPLVSCFNFPLCLIQMRLTVDTPNNIL